MKYILITFISFTFAAHLSQYNLKPAALPIIQGVYDSKLGFTTTLGIQLGYTSDLAFLGLCSKYSFNKNGSNLFLGYRIIGFLFGTNSVGVNFMNYKDSKLDEKSNRFFDNVGFEGHVGMMLFHSKIGFFTKTTDFNDNFFDRVNYSVGFGL